MVMAPIADLMAVIVAVIAAMATDMDVDLRLRGGGARHGQGESDGNELFHGYSLKNDGLQAG
jgi:hypothetical protein